MKKARLNDFIALMAILALVLIFLPSVEAANNDDADPAASRTLNVRDFGAKGDGVTVDTVAFAAALTKLAESGGGTLTVPSGSYLVGDLKVGSGTKIKGAGVPLPVLIKTADAKTILDISGEIVSGARQSLHDITIDSLILRGRSVEDGFKEHIHNIVAIGVKTLVIHDVVFEAFQGDGLYLGSRLQQSEAPLHNSDVAVANSEFRGVNSQNRNGISVIDCDRCILEHNSFSDLSLPNMPGPIDIEPNRADEIIHNVILRDNTVKGTNGAAFSVNFLANDSLKSSGHVIIENNYIEHAAIGILASRVHAPIGPAQPVDLLIAHNVIRGAGRPLMIDSMSDVTVYGNEFSDSPTALQIGCTSASNIHLKRNRFVRVGSESGSAVLVCGTISSLEFRSNIFMDAGSRAKEGSGINFGPASVRGVAFFDNIFSSPHHVTYVAVRSAATARLKDGKVVWSGNVLNDDIVLGTFPQHAD